MRRHRRDPERGTATLMAIGFMIFLLAMAGFAVDLGYQMAAIGELERSMEAAALAGAGKLGFNDTYFPTVRQFAQQYGQLNPQHNTAFGKLINLDENLANAADGNIVLGIWDGTAGTFSPSLDGTLVNAVRCQFNSQVQTTFLRVLGFQTLPISASATAYSPIAANVPIQSGCLFPVGVGSCPFENKSSTVGCGATATFITSSGKEDAGSGCLSPPCTNTSSWVNLVSSGTPNANDLKKLIQDIGNGICPASPFNTGDDIGTNNGMSQSVMDVLEPIFVQKYNESPVHEVKDSEDNVTYSGKGWKVFVPIIKTACPAGAISGDHEIVGWTEFVIAQVINKGKCAVENPSGGASSPWATVGTTNGCTAPKNEGAMRAIFGYYSCKKLEAPPATQPGPRAALGNRLKLVKMWQ